MPGAPARSDLAVVERRDRLASRRAGRPRRPPGRRRADVADPGSRPSCPDARSSGSFGGLRPPANVAVGPMAASTCSTWPSSRSSGSIRAPARSKQSHASAEKAVRTSVAQRPWHHDLRRRAYMSATPAWRMPRLAIRAPTSSRCVHECEPKTTASACLRSRASPCGGIFGRRDPTIRIGTVRGRLHSRRRIFVAPTSSTTWCIASIPAGAGRKRCPASTPRRSIAIDCRDRLYVVVNIPAPAVRVVDGLDARLIDTETDPASLDAIFPADAVRGRAVRCHRPVGAMPAAARRLPCCYPSRSPATAGSTPTAIRSIRKPRRAAAAICLIGQIPIHGARQQDLPLPVASRDPARDDSTGTQIVVRTFSADEAYTDAQLDMLADWRTDQSARGPIDSAWDCLVRSGPGRLPLARSSSSRATAPRHRSSMRWKSSSRASGRCDTCRRCSAPSRSVAISPSACWRYSTPRFPASNV